MTNTRQPGYYRVIYNGEEDIAKCVSTGGGFGYWKLFGRTGGYSDRDFQDIDPTPINPEPQQNNKDARISELENALNSLRGIEAWIGDAKMKQFFQKTVNSVLADQETGKV